MKKSYYIFGFFGFLILCGFYIKQKYYEPRHLIEKAKTEVLKLVEKSEIQNGDLIFQTSLSAQSKAIQSATNSKYSHCGLIFKEGKNYFVFEAIQPVKKTTLEKWIARGKNGHFVIKRLKNSNEILTKNVLAKMRQEGQDFLGKNYDLTFEWSDDKIYCSELIWKIYKRATGIEIGKLEKLENFDITNEIVKAKMKERYGDKIPKDEITISPRAIFESELLETIKQN